MAAETKAKLQIGPTSAEVAMTAGISAVSQLRALELLKEKGGTLQIVEFVKPIGISTAALTQLFDALQRKGLVERIRDAMDRRAVHIQLTEQGQALVAKFPDL